MGYNTRIDNGLAPGAVIGYAIVYVQNVIWIVYKKAIKWNIQIISGNTHGDVPTMVVKSTMNHFQIFCFKKCC